MPAIRRKAGFSNDEYVPPKKWPRPEQKTWGLNWLDIDPKMSRTEALVYALKRWGKPVK